MSSYVITGVSKGLGWEFMSQISSNADNTVIGIVRNKKAADERVSNELNGRTNITILEADVTDYEAVKRAVDQAAIINSGSLDYLIANAGYVLGWDAYGGIGSRGLEPERLTAEFRKMMDTNVLANIHLYNLFMPQILKGKAKKVVVISSGMGDIEFTNELGIEIATLYSASKAAMNMITAKFAAQYKKDGILFLSICPGQVDVGHFSDATAEELQGFLEMGRKFTIFNPDFKGMDQPADAIKAILSLVDTCSIENGDSGRYLSHFGNRRWI
ncbi:hypothetical protein B0T22DRAFT_302726 [Podospora appendiculata]|uniref:Short chain dehydrogenase n=1 Tax=Podospora appendiculata TaxID=314037 RepID=A0AAE1C792_9PEZI|nr:hypothetical protein B0T22DRAFT_302726 [Podospora appendiculata]